MINAASADTFGFDCVCLIKGILWGWRGDTAKSYGGASYAVNGVPDIGADQMITKCAGVSTDFSNVAVGEALWCEGHIGVYIGNGLGVECTPRWDNKVQITAVANIGKKEGYNARTWRKHGKLPYIDYIECYAGHRQRKNAVRSFKFASAGFCFRLRAGFFLLLQARFGGGFTRLFLFGKSYKSKDNGNGNTGSEFADPVRKEGEGT